jgi:hypothetical protein
MALSGWCGTRGRPDCGRCRGGACSHECHGANPAQNKGNGRGIETVEWENRDAPAGCVNTAARADHLPALPERG